MLKQNLGRVTRKTEPTENSENWTNGKFMSLILRVSTEYQHRPLWTNWKMAAISLISVKQKNFKLLTPQSLGLWFSKCWWKQNIRVGHYEKIKNGHHLVNIDCTEKFQMTNPPKFGSLVFRVLMEMEYQHWPLWQSWKMVTILLISIVQKISNYWPPKFWVSGFLSVDRNGISASAIMKKLKNVCHFC